MMQSSGTAMADGCRRNFSLFGFIWSREQRDERERRETRGSVHCVL